jgi:hypothetical protein
MDNNEYMSIAPPRWSGPWHALQRRLAERFCAEEARFSAGAGAPTRRLPAPEAGISWMARARNPINSRIGQDSQH